MKRYATLLILIISFFSFSQSKNDFKSDIQKTNWSTANTERGIYFYSLVIDDKKQETKKLVLIK